MTHMRTCETCRFWARLVYFRQYGKEVAASCCRKNAPRQSEPQGYHWPLTDKEDWCGEHQQKEGERTPLAWGQNNALAIEHAVAEARADFASLAAERVQTLEAICDVMRRQSIATGAADTIEQALSALEEGVADKTAALGLYYDALRDIAAMPEQGGCDDGIDAVDLWMLMQRKAQEVLP